MEDPEGSSRDALGIRQAWKAGDSIRHGQRSVKRRMRRVGRANSVQGVCVDGGRAVNGFPFDTAPVKLHLTVGVVGWGSARGRL